MDLKYEPMTKKYEAASNIEYIEINEKDVDIIGPLWERLIEHLRVNSKYFSERLSQHSFHTRKKDIFEKAKSGAVRIDLARDLARNQFIAYCISSITKENEGEIDSIYVEDNYRRLGIGDCFMKKALSWIDAQSVETKKIVIVSGFEKVIAFYSRYGLFQYIVL